MASGFFYGYCSEAAQGEQKTYFLYLVTNKHVLEGQEQIAIRLNRQNSLNTTVYEINSKRPSGHPLWYFHDVADVAVIPIDYHKLVKDEIQSAFFKSENHVANLKKIKELQLSAGDFVYALGFPMGLVGEARNSVIVRGGTIAKIINVLEHNEHAYLIDCFIFPGNSGGPVVNKIEFSGITGTGRQSATFLIGIVQGYVPYKDVAISQQTGETRVIFKENSGLTAVIPVDYIDETIKKHLMDVVEGE